MIHKYYKRVQNDWLNSNKREKLYQKQFSTSAPNVLADYERKFINIVYTLFMPIMLIEIGISDLLQKVKIKKRDRKQKRYGIKDKEYFDD